LTGTRRVVGSHDTKPGRAETPVSVSFEEGSMAVQTGKRYVCPKCGSEFIVTKGGDAEITCGGTPLELKK